MMMQHVDVFVSYSHEDRRRVRYLVRQLERAGLSVWFDARLRPSETWPRRLREEIRDRRIFLFLITSSTLQSEWCRWELYQAARANRLVLPVLFEAGVSLPPELRYVHYVDCSDRRGCVEKVLEAIRKALEIEETIYRLRPSETAGSIGVRGQTLLGRLPQKVQTPVGPRYPSRWRQVLMEKWGVLLGGLAAVAVLAILVGALYIRHGSNVSTGESGTLTDRERTAVSTLLPVSPTVVASPSPSPTATATVAVTEDVPLPSAHVCALGEKIWVREQPLEGAHAFTAIAPNECMEMRWLFADDVGRIWGYVPEATRGPLNRGGWVAVNGEGVRLEGSAPSVFDEVLCEGLVRIYDAGLSTTTNITPRYVSLHQGEHVWLFAYEVEAGAAWYYAATRRDDWVFGWIPADQVTPLGQCPAPQ